MSNANKQKWDLSYEEFYNKYIGYYTKVEQSISNTFKVRNLKISNPMNAEELLKNDYKKLQDTKHALLPFS